MLGYIVFSVFLKNQFRFCYDLAINISGSSISMYVSLLAWECSQISSINLVVKLKKFFEGDYFCESGGSLPKFSYKPTLNLLQTDRRNFCYFI